MSILFLNDEYIDEDDFKISHQDSGLSTSNGVFDSMLAHNGTPVHLDDHYDRLMHDASIVIGNAPNLSKEKFLQLCANLLEKNNLTNGYARIRSTITGGTVSAPLALSTYPTFFMSVGHAVPPNEIKPIKCAVITDYPRIAGCALENCKRLDYSRSYAARRKAQELGADEAIVTNTNGNIACGATSNIFIQENGNLITPPLSEGVLAGVTRKNLMIERDVKEEIISLNRLKSADQIYLTNSFFNLRDVILK